jgi:hypothetical protein
MAGIIMKEKIIHVCRHSETLQEEGGQEKKSCKKKLRKDCDGAELACEEYANPFVDCDKFVCGWWDPMTSKCAIIKRQ